MRWLSLPLVLALIGGRAGVMIQACRFAQTHAELIMASQLELYQQYLLQKSLPLSEKVVESFYRNPRHLFIPEYGLEEAYSDQPLLLYSKGPFESSISQPTLVLKVLDLLSLSEGQKVFELGTGSGWNTALMSTIVGDSGKIVSVEIIPEMFERAHKALALQGVKNVLLLEGDGFEGYPSESPYDRIIFTAGAREFPEKLFSQLAEDGLMIFVRESPLGYNSLELIRKERGLPVIMDQFPCSFVPVVRKKESRLEGGILD